MRTRLAIGLGLALAACGAADQALPPDAAILPGSAVAAMLHQCSRLAPAPGEGSWTPEAGDIARLEAALPAAVRDRAEIRRSHYPSDPDWARVPEGWRRQYVGLVRGGRRFIYGNFYPRRDEVDVDFAMPGWRTEPAQICDGGAVIFGAEYDVEAGRFTQIAFNGELG
jgi:hypothetical protein